ncbi:MAG: hypothetical protein HY438_02840 [DPANN group archaeon]|nr:hypothetical protein [DPANN group archaeon]
MHPNLKEALRDLETPKQEKEIKVTIDKETEKAVEILLGGYNKFVAVSSATWINTFDLEGTLLEYMPRIRKINLKPSVIEEFMNRLQMPDSRGAGDRKRNINRTYFLISSLIQFSYDTGHNGFQITVSHLEKPYELGHNFISNPDNPLRIEVFGDIGNLCFRNTKCVDVIIRGDVGRLFGEDSYGSSFTVHGTMGEQCGISSTCCTFKHASKKTLDAIEEEVDKYSRNRYYLLKDGREIPYKPKGIKK